MPVGYVNEKPNSPSAGHLRKRSSAQFSSSAFTGANVATMMYNERTGEIRLPDSPPLNGWNGKEKNALGLSDKQRRRKSGLSLGGWENRRSKGRMPVTKPWVSVLAFGGGTFFLYCLFSLVKPDMSSSPYNEHHGASYPGQGLFSPRNTCDPYASKGHLRVDLSEPDRNHWIPDDPSCVAPSFLQRLRNEQTQPGGDLAWFSNRTVLLLGDAVSREHVENFCTLMHGQSEVVRPGHKYGQATMNVVRDAVKSDHPLDRPARLSNRASRSPKDMSLPRVCYIPKYDFLLASVFHFGLDQEDYWRTSKMPQYSAPGLFEHRLSDIAQGLVRAFRGDHRLSAPDLVEISSGSWDLARWAEQDIANNVDPSSGLSKERLTWYKFRVGQVLARVREAFPDATARVWRTMHYPTDEEEERAYFMEKIISAKRQAAPKIAGKPSSTPNFFAPQRIQQMESVVRSLIVPAPTSPGSDAVKPAPYQDFRMNEWGLILKGEEAHQRDRMHGDPLPGGYVWADMMLYDLYRGVVSTSTTTRWRP